MTTIKNLPNVSPTTVHDFAKSQSLAPGVSITRASIGTYINDLGEMGTAGVGVPRFTHDISTNESLGILVEQASTNYAPPPTLWGIGDLGVTVEKDGGEWYKCSLYHTGGSSRQIANTISGFPNPTDTTGLFSFSLEVSRDMTTPSKKLVMLLGYNGYADGYSSVNFDLTTLTGVVSRSQLTAKLPPVVLNYSVVETVDGWRCSVSFKNEDTTIAVSSVQFGIYPGNVVSETEMGYQKYRYIQVEQLPYATSFIPTTTTAPATRALDTFKIDFENNERSFILEFNQPLTSGMYGLFISTVPVTNVLVVYSQQYPNNNIGNTVNWRNVYINEPIGAALQSGNKTSRIAMVCAENEYRLYINGVRETFETASSNGVPEIIKSLVFNGGTDGGMNTTVFKRISSYQETLTDDEACRLTKIV